MFRGSAKMEDHYATSGWKYEGAIDFSELFSSYNKLWVFFAGEAGVSLN